MSKFKTKDIIVVAMSVIGVSFYFYGAMTPGETADIVENIGLFLLAISLITYAMSRNNEQKK
jgi:hypothetical protein